MHFPVWFQVDQKEQNMPDDGFNRTQTRSDEAIKKAESLDNSRLLDVHKWSEYREVNRAVDFLYSELKLDGHIEGLAKKHIKIVILDLYVCWLEDDTKWIMYHRGKTKYKGSSRYNKLHISYRIVAVIDALQERGYISHHLGFNHPNPKKSRVSRMRAGEPLIRLFRDTYSIPSSEIVKAPNTECIMVKKDNKRTKKKELIEYRDTPVINLLRRRLTKYNNLLFNTYIDSPQFPPEGVPYTFWNHKKKRMDTKYRKINPDEKFNWRVFNNINLLQGGRYYGGWWQGLNSEWRSKIRINDNPVVEIDYSGIHIILLYANEGIDYWDQTNRDVYDLSLELKVKDDFREYIRALGKLVVLTAVNAMNRAKAKSAIQKEINFNPDEYSWFKDLTNVDGKAITLDAVLDAFIYRHPNIEHYLFSNLGRELQNADAGIATQIIDTFTDEHIPVLCVHDSFLIEEQHLKYLNRTMDTVFKKDALVISLKNKKSLSSLYRAPRTKIKESSKIDTSSGTNINPLYALRLEEKRAMIAKSGYVNHYVARAHKYTKK